MQSDICKACAEHCISEHLLRSSLIYSVRKVSEVGRQSVCPYDCPKWLLANQDWEIESSRAGVICVTPAQPTCCIHTALAILLRTLTPF